LHSRVWVWWRAEEVVETHVELWFWSGGILGSTALPLVLFAEVVGFGTLVVMLLLVALGVRAPAGAEA